MRRLTVTVLAIVLAVPMLLRADPDRIQSAADVLAEMTGEPDKGVPVDLIQKADCIIIIPSVIKAAFGVGGRYGRGYLACRQNGSWSAPAAVRLEGGSIGFQIGGSSTDYILLVMNQHGVDHLMSSQFKLGAEGSVAAGPVGRQAAAETDLTMHAEMLAWSRSRGVFAGISLEGSTLRSDTDENEQLYGKQLSTRDVIKGKVSPSAQAEPLMNALKKLPGGSPAATPR